MIDVHVATLAVLAALLMGLAKENISLPLVTVIAAIASTWLTDLTGHFSLKPRFINVAVVLIAVVSAARYLLFQSTTALGIVVDAFIWLQIAILFEKKDSRTWWDLISLSLMLLFIAAQINEGPAFAPVLVAYLFFGLSTLALLLLHREDVRCLTARDPSFFDKFAASHGTNWPRVGKVALATLAVGPMSLFLRFRRPSDEPQSPDDRRRSTRWPLLDRKPVLVTSSNRPGNATTTGREFWCRVTGMTLVCLVLSMVVFCIVPRFGRAQFLFPRFGQFAWGSDTNVRRSVGFSDSVTLGELGSIIEDPEVVLELQLTDYLTDEHYPVEQGVYLRGAVLTRYEAGEWSYHRSGGTPRIKNVDVVRQTVGRIVRQRIKIEPMDRNELFCVWPFMTVETDKPVTFDARTERLHRPQELRNRQFSFDLATTAFVDGVQGSLLPSQKFVAPKPLLQWPADALPGLAALANRWVTESEIPRADSLGRARLLESRLSQSARFSYSLQGQERDSTIDPIEDFITNNPRGHCEYFATALTLMLRAEGIPARMIVGYQCDEYSFLSQVYRVRQSHAHTWVEAYVPPNQIPAEVRDGDSLDWSNGAWLRLDPTPAASGLGIGMVAQGMENWLEWMRSSWRRDVMGMNKARQREAIYGPLADQLKRLGSWGPIQAQMRFPRSLSDLTRIARALVLPVVLVILVLLLARGRFWKLLKILRLQLAAMAGRSPPAVESSIEFYRRLEALLERLGLIRPIGQTQREFARQAGRKIATSTGRLELGNLPNQVAEAFYRVRFGRLSLDDGQQAAVQQALQRLEEATNGRLENVPLSDAPRA